MLKWLRDKMLTGSEGEFNKCIDMCHTFIKFAEKKEGLFSSRNLECYRYLLHVHEHLYRLLQTLSHSR